MNSKFLKEAIEMENRWSKSGLLDGLDVRWMRSTCAVLLESQRFQGKDQTDEDYEEYVQDFIARQRRAMGKNTYKNFWLEKKRARRN